MRLQKYLYWTDKRNDKSNTGTNTRKQKRFKESRYETPVTARTDKSGMQAAPARRAAALFAQRSPRHRDERERGPLRPGGEARQLRER